MKRLLIVLVLALAAGLLLGPFLKSSMGYVIVVLGDPAAEHTTVRLRLWFAIALLLLGMSALLMVWRLLRGTGRAFTSTRLRQRRAKKKTVAGMIALAEGHWQKAETQIMAGSKSSEVPLLNYLMAAQAAQMQKAGERRDEYLRQAALAEPEAQVAIGLTQAQLQLQQGQKELALATLNHVRELAPKHPYVLKLLKKLYVQFEDWPALLELMPAISKHKLLPEDERAELELRAHGAQLRVLAAEGTAALTAYWQGLSKESSQNPDLLAQYAELLQSSGAGAEAEALVLRAQRKHYHGRLAEIYGRLDGRDPAQQLANAEAWLKPETRTPGLLVALARLAMRNALWGKARHYLEDALALKSCPEAWWLMAEVYEQMGDKQGAQASYRRGLGDVLATTPSG